MNEKDKKGRFFAPGGRKDGRERKDRSLYCKGGRWYTDFYFGYRRYRRYAGASKGQAQSFLARLKVELDNEKLGFKPPVEKVEVPFETFAAEFLKLYSAKKRSYARDEDSMAHLKEFFKGETLQAIGSKDAEKYKEARQAAEPAPAAGTINRELALLRTMFYKAVEWGDLGAYPLQKRDLLLKEPRFEPRILTDAEVGRLLEKAAPHLKPILTVLLNTGMRRSEALKLTWGDVDLRKKLITIKPENSKSGKSREIPINSLAAETLRALGPGLQTGRVFLGPESKGIADVKTAFKSACRRAGIKRLRLHDLRHTAASRMIEAGADVFSVQQILGHSDIKITMIYCHPGMEVKRRAVEKLAEAFRQPAVSPAVTPVEVESETALKSVN